jgi:sodium transport system permease protein
MSEASAKAAVRSGQAPVVLIVPQEYACASPRQPGAGALVADSADSQQRKNADRARALLANYGSAIAQQRLQVRGVNPLLAMPVAVNDVDVATPTGRAVAILGFMTYFVLFAVLMGGLYLAIDSTAGERERGSLEALLSLPVPQECTRRRQDPRDLRLHVPLARDQPQRIRRRVSVRAPRAARHERQFGAGTALTLFAICLPFVPLGAALMTFVASFTRTYREAQTYLTSVLLIPTLPIAFASIYSLKTKSSLMLIPSLSQHLLMTSVLKAEPISGLDVLVSAGASLGLALVLAVLTARHWRRETMLL